MMVGTHWPDVVVVNGPSSAGKTTLCRGLQEAITHPYLYIGFDDFVSRRLSATTAARTPPSSRTRASSMRTGCGWS